MAVVSIKILFAHWLAFLDALQRFFWHYTPQPLLSIIPPALIEDSSKFSQLAHVPRTLNPSDYTRSVNPATICFVPTILPVHLAMNFSCSTDRPDYDLADESTMEQSRFYVFLDIPAWRPDVPDEDVHPISPSAQGDYAQTNMAPYGARGLSFCPVLVGIAYVQSLLNLYMLLMIPSLCNHWFEDVPAYESLNPIELLDCLPFLHMNLWMVPWSLLRCGVRRVASRLYRVRKVTCKPARPPVPRIVLTRVDGEAVPINFVESNQSSVAVGVRSSFEAVNLDMGDHQDVTSDGKELQDLVQFPTSIDEYCIETESEALSVRTTSDPGEHQDKVCEAQSTPVIELGPLTSKLAEDSLSVNQVPDHQVGISVIIEATNKPLPSVEEGILLLSSTRPDAPVSAPGDWDIDNRTDESVQVACSEAVADDVPKDGADGLGERRCSGEDPASFSPWSLVDGNGPDESGTLSDTVSATSSFVGSQGTPTQLKNVRFALGGVVGTEDHWKVCSSSTPSKDESTCAWNPASPVEDDVALRQNPVVSFNPMKDMQDATSRDQPTVTIPLEAASEERAEKNDALGESSPSGELIVNLPSLVTIRGGMRFAEMDVVPIEDVATRSPLQMLSPTEPVVSINTNCLIKVGEQSPTREGIEDPDWEYRVGCALEILGDEGAMSETFAIVSGEDWSCLPDPAHEVSYLSCSPIVEDCEPFLGGIETLEVASSTSGVVSEAGTTMINASLPAIDTSPSSAIEAREKDEPGGEILYETPRYCQDGKGLAGSPQIAAREPGVGIADVTNTRIHLPTASGSPNEPNMVDQVIFVTAEKSEATTVALTCRPVSLFGSLSSELSMTKPSEQASELSGTSKETGAFSMVFVEKNARKLHQGESCGADIIPWDRCLISKSPERTLSSSIHAPRRPLPILQSNGHIGRTSVLYEAPPPGTRSVPLVRYEAGKEDASMPPKTTSKRRKDLSASIHAPQGISNLEAPPRDKNDGEYRPSATNEGIPENKPMTKPRSPNWVAMPEVVDALRIFKQAAAGRRTIQRVSSMAEHLNRGPMPGVVGQKGIATNSLNNISATANIQNHWMHGSGLLLVRDLVSSDPADFNLRSCANLRIPKTRGANAPPVQQVLYPGMLDTPSYPLHGLTPRPVGIDTDFSSMVAGSTGIQGRQSVLALHDAEIETTHVAQRWTTYRG